MKKQLMAAVIAAMVSGGAYAQSCSSSFSLGTMGPPDAAVIGNSFSRTGAFNDCYTFNVNSSANMFGLTLEWDLSGRRDIDLSSVTLSGGSLGSALLDVTPGSFSATSLGVGTYLLQIAGLVTGRNGGGIFGGPVGYLGSVVTSAATVTSPVPEPSTYALMLAGLAVVGWSARRRLSR